MGQKIAVLHNGQIKSGFNYFSWDGGDFSSGIYIMKTSSDNFVNSQKLMLIK